MMKTKDLLTVSAVAIGTAVLTLTILLPDQLGAEGDNQAVSPTIPDPKLLVRGVELTLTPREARALKAGDRPEFDLRAINTLDERSDVTVLVNMLSSAPPSPMSRMLSLPTPLWYHEFTFTLEPREASAVRLAVESPLPENRIISVQLAEKGAGKPITSTDARLLEGAPALLPHKGVVALSFSTQQPEQQPALAVLR